MAQQPEPSDIINFLQRNENTELNARGRYFDAATGRPPPAGSGGIQACAKRQHDRFVDEATSFMLKNPDIRTRTRNFDLRQQHSFVDVLAEANVALDGPQGTGRFMKVKAHLKKAVKGVQDASPAIAQIADATLPAGDYTSIVSGGIVLIFKAFKVVADVHKLVKDTLQDAPQILDTAERLIAIHPEAERLKDLAAQLQVALLCCIMRIINWAEQNRAHRLYALILQESYMSELKAHIGLVALFAKDLEKEADLCDRERMQKIVDIVKRVWHDMDTLILQNEQLLFGQEQISDSIMDVSTGVGATHQLTISIAEEQTKQATRTEKISETSDMNNGLLKAMNRKMAAQESKMDLLTATVALLSEPSRRWPNTPVQSIVVVVPPPQLVPSLTHTDVLGFLGDWRKHNTDVLEYLVSVSNEDEAQLALKITTSEHFQEWFTSADSQSLLISYDGMESQLRPGSNVTASAAAALIRVPSVICLLYSAGGTDRARPADSISQMMACLVSSVLTSINIDLEPWMRIRHWSEHQRLLQSQDLEYLCQLFSWLIRSMKGGTVFCLIDDFQELESTSEPSRVQAAFACLQSAVAYCSQTRSIVLKVLCMTVPFESDIATVVEEDTTRWINMDAGSNISDRM